MSKWEIPLYKIINFLYNILILKELFVFIIKNKHILRKIMKLFKIIFSKTDFSVILLNEGEYYSINLRKTPKNELYLIFNEKGLNIKKIFFDKEIFDKVLKIHDKLSKEEFIPRILEKGVNYIIIPYYKHNIESFIEKYKLNKEQRFYYAFKIIEYIQKLYENGIIHGDIYKNNVFIENNHPVIIDFEYSREIEENIPFEKSYDIKSFDGNTPVRLERLMGFKSEEIIKKIKLNKKSSDYKVRFTEIKPEQLNNKKIRDLAIFYQLHKFQKKNKIIQNLVLSILIHIRYLYNLTSSL